MKYQGSIYEEMDANEELDATCHNVTGAVLFVSLVLFGLVAVLGIKLISARHELSYWQTMAEGDQYDATYDQGYNAGYHNGYEDKANGRFNSITEGK